MKKLKKMLYWILGIVAVLAVTVLLVLQHPDFGRPFSLIFQTTDWNHKNTVWPLICVGTNSRQYHLE